MSATLLHVLFEHATGYALFKVKEFEEIAMFLPQVEASIIDVSKFHSIVKLVAFSPFKSGSNALDNINSVSEGIMHEDLRLFLETNMPKGGKKSPVILGVGDRKMGDAIFDELGIRCQYTGVVQEISRGLRQHFPKMVKGLTDLSAGKAQLGLGHSYSRAKVKFNVNRIDNMIIQSISLLDQLDKDINTFSMRIREWYSYHFPELVKIVPDAHLYAKVTRMVGDRKQLDDEKIEELGELLEDQDIAQQIVNASKSSMGMDISPIDLINIEMFASRVVALGNYRTSLQEYLRSKMDQVAPSLASLIGDMIGARLISHAGSLTNLAKYPASTVQILGAEKALFRALKARGNTPKYGLIFHSSFIGRAAQKNKGRISRYLANKCSMASRIDCFSDIPTSIFGDHLKQQVEDRLKFYTSGEIPDKNIDVMKKASDEATVVQAKIAKKLRKKRRKSSQSTADTSTLDDSAVNTTIDETTEKTPGKKKRKSDISDEVTGEETSKKKKKRKSEVEVEEEEEVEMEVEPVKKKKKKIIQEEEESVELCEKATKKKSKKSIEPQQNDDDDDEIVDETPKKKSKKKKENIEEPEEDETPKKKSKKKIGEDNVVVEESQKKSKKKSKGSVGDESMEVEVPEVTPKQKKKKRKSQTD